MIKAYFTIAIRNLIKYRGLTLIHILGLATGLTAGIYVIHYARLEYSYDTFHEHANRIYRVETGRVKDGVDVKQFAATFAGAGPAMKADFPEVETYTRMFFRWRGGMIAHNDIRFRETEIFNVDSGFFDVFSFPILAGRASELNTPGVAFVEEQAAKKYFGSDDPIGKRITFGTVEGIEEYEVRGVVQCPENSSIKFTFLLSYHNLARFFGTGHLSNWSWIDFHTFVKLKENTDPLQAENRFPELLKKYRGDRASLSRLSLRSLPAMYLESAGEFETGITGNKNVVQILILLGIVIIAIVVLNFINLHTAQSFTKAKEVGIRKTLGSQRVNLIIQFLIETGITNLAAMFFSCVMIALLLPAFNELTGKHIALSDFINEHLWKYVMTAFVSGTLVMGMYPALQLSSFKPLEALKGYLAPIGKGLFLREAFVAFQALVSFSLVASVLIIYDQVQYINQQQLGIDVQQTLVVRTPATVTTSAEYFSTLENYKSALATDPRITHIATSADRPGEDVNWISSTRRLGADANESVSMYKSVIDENFLDAMKLEIVAGRNFQKAQSTRDVLINETALRQLGIASAEASIGQSLLSGPDTFEIIGVVKDFHQVSPKRAIAPTLYHYNLETPQYFFVKYTAASVGDIIPMCRTAFTKVFPNDAFDYHVLDDFYNHQSQSETNLAAIVTAFCGLAIGVSALGLLGLTWFTVSRQKKQLAIRKVVGSTDLQLFFNASKNLFRTTLIGCVVGIPITVYAMSTWLDGFALHTSISGLPFFIAFITSFAVAFATVSGYTLKIIRINLLLSLKQE